MDEQNDIEKKAAEAVKQEAKKGAEKAGKELAKKVKKILLKLLLQIGAAVFGSFGGFLFLIIIVILIILGIFNGTSQKLHDATENGENAGDVGYVSRLVRINNDTRTYEIDSEEFIKYAEEFLNLNNLTAKGLGISDDYSELKKFMEAEIVTSFPDLRPYDERGNPVPEGEIQGCIQFEREKNGEMQPMEYMPYAEFSKKMAEMGVKIDDEETQTQTKTTYSQIQQAYEDIKYKFTIDNEGNVYYAGSSSHVTHVEFSPYAMEEPYGDGYYHQSGRESEEIFEVFCRNKNYQDDVKKYAMPFELLFALQLNTKNCGYTTAVADMAKDSLIVYEIQEKIVDTEEIIKYNWTSSFRCSLKHYIKKLNSDGTFSETTTNYGPVDGPVYDTRTVNADINGTDFYEKVTIGNSVTTLKPEITYVDCWIAFYNAKYTKQTSEPVVEPVKEETLPSEDYKLYPSMTWHNLESEFANSGLKYNPVSVDGTKGEDQKGTFTPEEKRDNRTITYYKTTTETNYEPPEEVEVEEQVEKFLSLLAVDPELIDEETGLPVFNVEDIQKNAVGIKEYEGIEGFVSKPINPIINDRQVLLFMLMNNEKTMDVSETISYLIKILTGEVKVDPSRREKYKPNPIPGGPGDGDGYVGGDVREKLWWAIKDMLAEMGIENDVIVASAVGNTSAESGFKPNNLENAANSKSGYSDETFTEFVDTGAITKTEFLAKMEWSPYPSKGGIYGYGLAQWTSVGRKERLWQRTKDVGLSIADEDAQIGYLVDEIDKRSPVCYWPAYFDTWAAIYADDSNEAVLNEAIKKATMYYCAHFEVGHWSEGRYTAALQAYRDFHNAERPEATGTMQDLVNEAIRICNSTDPIYRYHSVANENCGQNDCFDCGGFIFYLYNKFYPGVLKGTLGNWPADAYPGNFVQNHAHQKLGTVAQVGIENLKPGDVLYKGNFLSSATPYEKPKHHEMLYIGNGKIAHASGTNEAHPEKEVTIGNVYSVNEVYVYRLVD